MIVTEPPAARFEAAEAGASSEEHLLERISAVENRLSRLTERLERGLDLLLRQAQNSYFDRALVKALIALLTEDGVVQSERLEKLWNDRCQRDAEDQEASSRREELRLKVVANYKGNQIGAFEQLVNEGFLLIEDQQVSRGIKSLRRAAQIDAGNSLLLSFLGEHFFRAGETKLARTYLARAHEAAPENTRISLLLGLTCADEGEVEQAKKLLSAATRRGCGSFAAHYVLGRLFIAEQKWQQALREFKRALALKPSPEAHYALACLYYQLCRDSLAIRHLRKAVAMDESYGEAFHLLGLVFQRSGQEKLAEDAFQRAQNGRRIERSRKKQGTAPQSDTPLFVAPKADIRKLVTGGDSRLAEVLKQDALTIFSASDS